MSWKAPGVPLPWYKHYPREALADHALLSCIVTARAIAPILTDLTWVSPEPGVLLVGGRAPEIRQLAGIVNIDHRSLPAALDSLVKAGIFARDAVGRLYSVRVMQQYTAYLRDLSNGEQGGNPALLGPRRKPRRRMDAASVQHGRSMDAASVQHPCSTKRRDNRELPLLGVIPPVNAESESKSESKRRTHAGAREKVAAKAAPAVAIAGATVATANVVPLRTEAALPVVPGAGLAPRDRNWIAPKGSRQVSEDEWRALEAWNDVAGANKHFLHATMNAPRLKRLRERMASVGGLAGWLAVLRMAADSPLWCGVVGNGWQPGFDDIVSEAKFTKLREGGYAKVFTGRDARPPAASSAGYLLARSGLLGGDDEDGFHGMTIEAEAGR